MADAASITIEHVVVEKCHQDGRVITAPGELTVKADISIFTVYFEYVICEQGGVITDDRTHTRLLLDVSTITIKHAVPNEY
jgi:hypothetical protein